MNGLGRLFAGVLSNIRYFGPLFVCNVGYGSCAVACFGFFLCVDFWTIAVFMAVYGFAIGKIYF